MEKFLRNLVLPTVAIALLLVWQGESFAALWFGPPQVEMPFPSGGNLTIKPQQNLKPPDINFDLGEVDYFKDNKEYTFTLAVDSTQNGTNTTAIIWLPILHDPVDTSKGTVELKVDLNCTVIPQAGTFTATANGALGVIEDPGGPVLAGETGVYKGESPDNKSPFTVPLITFAQIKEKGTSGNYFYTDAVPKLEDSVSINNGFVGDPSKSSQFIHYKVSTLDDDDPNTPTDKPQRLPWPKIGIIKVYLQVQNVSTGGVKSTASLTLFARIDESVPWTAINLVSFNANADNNGGVTLAWETATEVDNAGFNLYRARGKNGKYKKINDTIIPAQGSVSSGAQYTFEDKPPAPGVFFYKLEDVDTSGVSTMHGPEKVRVRK